MILLPAANDESFAMGIAHMNLPGGHLIQPRVGYRDYVRNCRGRLESIIGCR